MRGIAEGYADVGPKTESRVAEEPQAVAVLSQMRELLEGLTHLRHRIQNVRDGLVGSEPQKDDAQPVTEPVNGPYVYVAQRLVAECRDELARAHGALSRVTDAFGV